MSLVEVVFHVSTTRSDNAYSFISRNLHTASSVRLFDCEKVKLYICWIMIFSHIVNRPLLLYSILIRAYNSTCKSSHAYTELHVWLKDKAYNMHVQFCTECTRITFHSIILFLELLIR